jgi:hypothetical protein
MQTKRVLIKDKNGNPIAASKALLWGNNAAWLCIECGELLGNRTGDSEYEVDCTVCTAKYEIERQKNKNGNLNLGPAMGIRKIC